jgi:hypothetical protein
MFGVLFCSLCVFLCARRHRSIVSSEQPVGADQEQVFEEEEPQCLSKEGKWTSPTAYSILSHTTCMITKFTFKSCNCINLMGNHLFKDMTRFYPLYLGQPFKINVLGRNA